MKKKYDIILFPALFWYDTYHSICMIGPLIRLPSVIQCGVSLRWPLLEYLSLLGRVIAIHLQIGHP